MDAFSVRLRVVMALCTWLSLCKTSLDALVKYGITVADQPDKERFVILYLAPHQASMLFFTAFVALFAIHLVHLLIFLWTPKAYWLS